jgi:poly-gamma-glutamate synthase PgsB/CapB
MKQLKKDIKQVMALDLSPMDQQLYKNEIQQLIMDFFKYEKAGNDTIKKRLASGSAQATAVITFLMHQLENSLAWINTLRTRQSEFNQRFTSANTRTQRDGLILKFAQDLGASSRQLKGDQKALQRFFGYDAVLERSMRRISETEYHVAFLLNRITAITAKALRESGRASEQQRILNHIDMENRLTPLLAYRGDERVRIALFRCMAAIFGHMSDQIKSEYAEERITVFIYRASLDINQPIWIQNETLELLSQMDADSFFRAADKRLFRPSGGDDFFVRKKIIQLLCDHIDKERKIKRFIPTITRDLSPFVRQTVVTLIIQYLIHNPPADQDTGNQEIMPWLRHMLLKDISAQVRAATLLEISKSIIPLLPYFELVTDLFADHFDQEQDAFALRAGFKTVVDCVTTLQNRKYGTLVHPFVKKVLPLIINLHQNAGSLSVRRWAALCREKLTLSLDEQAVSLMTYLAPRIETIAPGKKGRIPKACFKGLDDEVIGRVLSVLAQDDFGLGLKYGIFSNVVYRGDRFGFRLWRFIHELFTSSPDKRQGFSHTIGRKYRARISAPSTIGSELTQTKVPGEPLYCSTESGWRPYLPLVEELLHCTGIIFSDKPYRIFTSEGITDIFPPKWMIQKVYARIVLTLRFPHYAGLRNFKEAGGDAPERYIHSLRRLDFRIVFTSYQVKLKNPSTNHTNAQINVDKPEIKSNQHNDTDPAVARFFSIGIAAYLPFSTDLWERLTYYFFSAYENSLYELGLFSILLLTCFLSKHVYAAYQVAKDRKSINLVIGGWGTRGKSGVERLKAALFEALGHGFVNKTTGCEAMFLHTCPNGKTREMFLFRPYDKATIWEHHHLLGITRKLKSKIFLWECMALTPAFVFILQRQWTKDDYSTITNTYPDHEDIQGPAGIDIPQVMTHFIPKKGILVTSEEEMTPILTHASMKKSTDIHYSGWLESGLLTPDVLDRFPYEEHPANVALVLKLCELLEIDPDFAVREMADRVVPDIGALKVYPTAPIASRRLEFINGMSANERFAALGNWRRMGFAEHNHETQPGIMLSTVVNNRADRIPRSRTFASILVNDFNADRHFLIGSNLFGLLGFIYTEWDQFLKNKSLFDDNAMSADVALNQFKDMAQRLRILTSQDAVVKRIMAMMEGLELTPSEEKIRQMSDRPEDLAAFITSQTTESDIDTILVFVKEWNEEQRAFETFSQTIKTAFLHPIDDRLKTQLDSQFKDLITQWFKKKFIVIDNFHATGNQIIQTICLHTPPGLHNKIMGLQNIKGPGLDFVYRWQAWEACWKSGQKLLDENDPERFDEGFYELTTFKDYGILCETYLLDILSKTQAAIIAQTEQYQAGLSLIKTNLENALAAVKETLQSNVTKTRVISKIAAIIESILDAGDAVKRRKKANRIYDDLIHERISHDRAAMELKKLNQRQKGGWLNV